MFARTIAGRGGGPLGPEFVSPVRQHWVRSKDEKSSGGAARPPVPSLRDSSFDVLSQRLRAGLMNAAPPELCTGIRIGICQECCGSKLSGMSRMQALRNCSQNSLPDG